MTDTKRGGIFRMYLDVDKFLDEGFLAYETPIELVHDIEVDTSKGKTGIRFRVLSYNTKLAYLYELFLKYGGDMNYVDSVSLNIQSDQTNGRVHVISWDTYTIDVHTVELSARERAKVMIHVVKAMKKYNVGVIPLPGDIVIGVPQGANATGDGDLKRASIYKKIGMGDVKADALMYGMFNNNLKIKPL